MLLGIATVSSGAVMFGLFRQSASAQIGQAAALTAQACDAIDSAYRFYTAGWQGGEPDLADPGLRAGLTAVVVTALSERADIEGGLWQSAAGSLAYGYPTYEGSGPKTDVPSAELPRIRSLNRAAAAEDRLSLSRFDSSSQIQMIASCPLPGPIANLTAWTMTRLHTFGGADYQRLMGGIAILLLTVVGASILAVTLILTWSRHVERMERALGEHDIGDLPVLPPTGERELDRIVRSLNDAGRRLKASRARAEDLTRQIAAGERLAAVGRLSAGVAHEIRNPIAAIRLKSETALRGSVERKDQALGVVIEQVDRLDHLVRSLLIVGERDPPLVATVDVAAFLRSCADLHRELAGRKGVTIETETSIESAGFDAGQMGRALDNLVLNAVEVSRHSAITLSARTEGDRLVLAVADRAGGPPEALRQTLFEPFVTGRADGTGLGLSIVREIAETHGGTARFRIERGTTFFEIDIPWRIS